MRDVYIIGVGMLRFGKFPNRSIKDLSAQALNAALQDADLEASDIEALWFSNSGWGMNGGQDSIRGQVALRPIGVESIPIINVENACASGSTALNGAWLGVASGAFEVGVEALEPDPHIRARPSVQRRGQQVHAEFLRRKIARLRDIAQLDEGTHRRLRPIARDLNQVVVAHTFRVDHGRMKRRRRLEEGDIHAARDRPWVPIARTQPDLHRRVHLMNCSDQHLDDLAVLPGAEPAPCLVMARENFF